MEDLETAVPESAPREVEAVPLEKPVDPAPATSPTEETPGAPLDPATSPGSPAYKPSLKYTLRDKEYSFDDEFKELVKTESQEKKLRELYEKARGLDEYVNPAFDKTSTELNSFKQSVNTLAKFRDKNDFDSVFSMLGMTEEKVLQWAVKKAEYYQLPPDQKNMVDQRRQAELLAHEQQTQVQASQTQYQQYQAKANQEQLNMAMEIPTFKEFAEKFNTVAGKPSGFIDEVVRRGNAHYLATGENLSALQIIKQVQADYGPFISQQGGGSQAQPSFAPRPPTAPGKEPPVLPNLNSGKASVPTKKRPTSIEDLKKLARDMDS